MLQIEMINFLPLAFLWCFSIFELFSALKLAPQFKVAGLLMVFIKLVLLSLVSYMVLKPC